MTDSERTVSISVSWEGDVDLPVGEALGHPWPEGLAFTAANFVEQIKLTQTGLTYRPQDFVKDVEALDPLGIEIHIAMVDADGSATHARWSETGNG